jgi:threonine aldolase
MHEIADFRSDKVARPTREMMEAMASCEWGDGLYDEGPTVRELEGLAARATGKEAALFVASGTMANQIAVHTHTKPGDTVVLDDTSHIFWTEGGTGPTLSGVQTFGLPSKRGLMRIEDVRRVFARLDVGARPTLVCTENTHNFGGGRLVPIGYLREIRSIAKAHDARVHLDGARIFNASVRSGIPVKTYAATSDSIMFCLSKGLCAPVGSMLCGDREFIGQAKRFRERIGGLLKQSAPLAAAGLVALKTMVARLRDDHANATRLAKGFRALRGLDVEPSDTNMVFVTVRTLDGDCVVNALEKRGVLTYHLGAGRLRFAVHRDVDSEDVDRAVGEFRKVLRGRGAR